MQKRTFDKVWYVPGENGVLPKNIRAQRDVGTLVIGDSAIEFQGDKADLSIGDVRQVSFGLQGRVFAGNWVRIEYGSGKVAFFADRAYLGWGDLFGGTKEIFKAAVMVRRAHQRARDLAAIAMAGDPANIRGEVTEDVLKPAMERPQEQASSSEQSSPSTLEKLKAESQVRSGANVFFLIAAMSLLNSIILLAGASWYFLIGLGMTQVVDGLSMGIADNVSSGAATMVRGIGFVLVVGISAVFVLFGVYGRRMQKWPFIAGMVMYGLDGLLLLAVRDYLGFVFHLFFLFLIYNGLRAHRRLSQVELI
jgi:hypothetical protein